MLKNNRLTSFIIKFTIKAVIMRTIRGNDYRHPRQNQKFKLSALLDFYQVNPQQEYTIAAHNDTIKTFIGSNKSSRIQNSQSEHNEESINFSGVDDMARKTVGLFSNLIKQIKVQKQVCETPSEPQKKREYEFYYKFLKDNLQASPMRGTSTKKVKDRALGIAEDSNFKHIDLNVMKHYQEKKRNENNNYLNTQPQKLIFQKQNHKRKGAKTAFVDLDFSFEEINFEEEQLRLPSKEDERKEIRIVDMAKLPTDNYRTFLAPKEQSESIVIYVPKEEKQDISLPKPLIPLTVSKEVDSNNNSQFLKIPFKERFQVQSNKLKKLNELCINTQSKEEDFRVEGAKKVQSHIYEHPLKVSCDPKDIEIDFDLDLNFI